MNPPFPFQYTSAPRSLDISPLVQAVQATRDYTLPGHLSLMVTMQLEGRHFEGYTDLFSLWQ